MSHLISFIPNHSYMETLNEHPVPASKLLPDWFKNTPMFVDLGKNKFNAKCCPVMGSPAPNTTIKNCTPFLDSLTSGYIFKLPVDVQFRYTDKGYIEFQHRLFFTDPNDVFKFEAVTTHSREQHPLLPNLNIRNNCNALVFKWMPGYSVKTPPGYSTLFTHPINRYELPFIVYTGVVDTDNYSEMTVSFPFQIKYEFKHEDDILLIPKGTPICQAIPFKRNNWKNKVEKYDKDKIIKSRVNYFSKIVDAYKSRFWVKKIYG